MSPTLTIEVYFDLICPWCLIGKRHLATALEQFRESRPDVPVRVVWRPYPLLPDIPAEGLPYQEFYERRLGGPAAVAARRAQVQAAADLAGIEFAFNRIGVMPNTLTAHRLIGRTKEDGSDEEVERLIEKLFVAYFMDGRDIGDPNTLRDLAAECVEAADQPARDIRTAELSYRGDVPGVPFYVFNGRPALSGAHPPQILLEIMERSIA